MKKFYKNAPIKTKIRFGFYVIIFFSALVAIIGIISLFTISRKYTDLQDGAYYCSSQVSDSLIITNDLRRALNTIVVQDSLFNSSENVNMEIENIYKKLDTLKINLNNYLNSLENDPNSTELMKKNGNLAADDITYLTDEELLPVLKTFENAIQKKDRRTVSECINKSVSITNDMNTVYTYMSDLSDATIDEINDNIDMSKTIVLIAVIAILTIIILLSVIIANITSKEIYIPMYDLSEKASMVAKGNFDVIMRTNRKDEIGKLSNDVSLMVDVFNSLIYDINELSDNMNKGNLTASINTEKYEGRFMQTAESVNKLAETLLFDLNTVSECVASYSIGDFSRRCPDMAGEKAVFNNTLNRMKEYFEKMNVDINHLVNNAKNGILDEKMDTDGYKGSWKDLADNFNELLTAIEQPVDAVSDAIKEIINGNLSVNIENKYSGKFGKMANDLNDMSLNLSSVVYEISDILKKMSERNLIVSAKQDYRGEFRKIKKAFELIISNFNSLINEISKSSDSMLNSSELVSQASLSIADGASKQTMSVEKLNETTEELAERIKHNGESTELMEKLVFEAIEDAKNGNEEITKMMEDMESINTASEDISNIILAIDDIAFQTNILALNASVEAARAGSAGQGFAVVAGEVRNLARRSQKAAQQSSELINKSRKTVEKGMMTAQETFSVLKLISERISKIWELSKNIDESSKIQNESVNKISENINVINKVVMVNAENSEKSAYTSEKLTEKAKEFREMINSFRIKEV